VAVYAAARALSDALYETFGEGRRRLVEQFAPQVSAHFVAAAREFKETEEAEAGFNGKTRVH
jgi:hypothetical protein